MKKIVYVCDMCGKETEDGSVCQMPRHVHFPVKGGESNRFYGYYMVGETEVMETCLCSLCAEKVASLFDFVDC